MAATPRSHYELFKPGLLFKNLVLFLFYTLLPGSIALFAQAFVPRFEPSDNPPFQLPKNQKYTFGYLIVPEDHTQPQGKTVKLPVFILKSKSLNPLPDPVLYTAGGPGGSSLAVAPYGQYYSYLSNRDFIIFEQRGTKYAQPSLDCPELRKVKISLIGKNLTEKEKIAAQVAATQKCRTRLVTEGINLSAYTTKQTAADIEALRQVLGIKQLNLYTESYSTKIAQTLMRDFPVGIRSVVMDSPLPLAVNYDEESNGNFVKSLELLLDNCEADPTCTKAFPNLKGRFYQALEKANKNPVAVTVKNPTDGKDQTVLLKGTDILNFIQLGSTYQLSRLPYLMNEIAEGSYQLLAPKVAELFKGDSRALGMRLSVWCAEEWQFATTKNIKKETNKYQITKGRNPSVFPAEVCRTWNVNRVAAVENRPVTSTIPTLIISGQYDPDTSTKWAKQFIPYLSNSFYFEFTGMSHVPSQYWDNNCAMAVAQAFFDNPAQRPVAPCFITLKPLSFTITPGK